MGTIHGLWGAIAKFRKVTVSTLMSVCPSVRMEQLDSHKTDFRAILLTIFRKSAQKIQISLKSYKNNGYVT